MNPNRQNNCYVNRSCGRTPVVQPVNQNCGPQVIAPAAPNCGPQVITPGTPCCNDGVNSGIIISGGVNQGCYKENAIGGLPVAMAYVPWQDYGSIYPLPQALQNGTMFPELNLDFAGRRCN